MKISRLFYVIYICFSTILLYGNNIQVTNISAANNNSNNGKVIQFDITWENSWRTTTPNSYDGAWVFFKIKDFTGLWHPLHFTNNNFNMPAGCAYTTVPDGVGIFLYRSAGGSGTVSFTQVKAGITSYPGIFEIRAFAIEMVYVPQGNFSLGDRSTGNTYHEFGGARDPFSVTSSTVYMGSSANRLTDLIDNVSDTLATFPTGYRAFWMMKYEVSQGAYRDYLNTLAVAQQTTIFSVAPTSASGTSILDGNSQLWYNHLYIQTPASGNTPAVVRCHLPDSASYEWKPISYISWADAAGYLDWAGLRPMTEMEYEKACRGSLAPVQNELAWGTDTYNNWTSANGLSHILTLLNNGETDEYAPTASALTGNAAYGTVLPTGGPTPSTVNLVRGGIFANAVSTRISSGAGYYGAMELSGNANEPTVTTANVAGRSFTGLHGDGVLTTAGRANVDHWPGMNATAGVTVANGVYANGTTGIQGDAGVMLRGGMHQNSSATSLEVSLRSGYLTGVIANNLIAGMGIRGVRGF